MVAEAGEIVIEAVAPAETVKLLLVTGVSPEGEAGMFVLPEEKRRRVAEGAVPLPAPVPMSRVVVPCRVAVPELSATVTFRWAGRPDVELLPTLSWVLTTGC